MRFTCTYFLLLKKWSYMLACYRHKAVSVLEYYLLGGASSYTEEWMTTAGSSHTKRNVWRFERGVTMTPGWPCNKPELTMKEATLYSAAMTPGKHGPHKYPWSFARLQNPRTSADTTSGRQYYRYITSLLFLSLETDYEKKSIRHLTAKK